MKLDRSPGLFAVVARATLPLISMVVVAGCGSAATAPRVTAPTTPSVGITRLMAAELSDADEAPRVGKPQHSHAAALDADDVSVKDTPHRHEHRRGGGFSGYK